MLVNFPLGAIAVVLRCGSFTFSASKSLTMTESVCIKSPRCIPKLDAPWHCYTNQMKIYTYYKIGTLVICIYLMKSVMPLSQPNFSSPNRVPPYQNDSKLSLNNLLNSYSYTPPNSLNSILEHPHSNLSFIVLHTYSISFFT